MRSARSASCNDALNPSASNPPSSLLLDEAPAADGSATACGTRTTVVRPNRCVARWRDSSMEAPKPAAPPAPSNEADCHAADLAVAAMGGRMGKRIAAAAAAGTSWVSTGPGHVHPVIRIVCAASKLRAPLAASREDAMPLPWGHAQLIARLERRSTLPSTQFSASVNFWRCVECLRSTPPSGSAATLTNARLRRSSTNPPNCALLS